MIDRGRTYRDRVCRVYVYVGTQLLHLQLYAYGSYHGVMWQFGSPPPVASLLLYTEYIYMYMPLRISVPLSYAFA